MSRLETRRVVAGIVIVAAVLQAGLAGSAFFARGSAEGDLADEQRRREILGARVEMVESAPTEEVVEAAPKWSLHVPDVSGTLQVVQREADAAGVELTGLKAAKSKTDGKQTFQITGLAAPADLCAFVARIEQHEQLVIVETGRVLPGVGETIAFEMGLSTYHPTREGSGQ